MLELTEAPAEGEFAPFYAGYVARVPRGDIIRTLSTQIEDTLRVVRSLPEARGGYRYAPDKWTIREMLGHLIDTERIFGYRALTFARGDTNPLPGFDENEYARASGSGRRTLAELTAELDIVRQCTVALFGSFDSTAVNRRGLANNVEVSVRALAYIIAGHERHHVEILRTRYLVS